MASKAVELISEAETKAKEIISDAEKKAEEMIKQAKKEAENCLLYTSPSPRDLSTSRMPSSA